MLLMVMRFREGGREGEVMRFREGGREGDLERKEGRSNLGRERGRVGHAV